MMLSDFSKYEKKSPTEVHNGALDELIFHSF